MAGPLGGVRLIEIAAKGPAPFAAMVLADLGAEIVRVDRTRASERAGHDRVVLHRGRRSVALNLKHPEATEVVLRLVEQADGLLEGFRPGVMERLGLGPDVCLERNPRLVYGRMTGWGQQGPLASSPGHDINYISVAGALRNFARPGERPLPPLNLIGDFGGGGMLLAVGLLAALVETSRSGEGQVVDAAMVDGTALLMTMLYSNIASGGWSGEPGTNLLDTGAHFYEVYETSDGRYVSVGAIEPEFYRVLLERLGLAGEELPAQHDKAQWPAMKDRFAMIFKTRTRDEWCEVFDGAEACFSPVLTIDESGLDPHVSERGTVVTRHGLRQPAPAPRFSRTPGELDLEPAVPGADTDEVLQDWGFTTTEIAHLRDAGAAL